MDPKSYGGTKNVDRIPVEVGQSHHMGMETLTVKIETGNDQAMIRIYKKDAVIPSLVRMRVLNWCLEQGIMTACVDYKIVPGGCYASFGFGSFDLLNGEIVD